MPAGASGSDAVKVLWIGGLTCEGPLGEVAAFDAPPPKQHPLQGVPGVQLRVRVSLVVCLSSFVLF